MTSAAPTATTQNRIVPRYDAFISYSHAADARLASALQIHLTAFAKPWYRWRAANVFHDETSLSASPELWPDLTSKLQDSAYLILLASTTSAESKWVQKELCYWISGGACETPEALTPELIVPDRVQRILIVLTEGTIVWDDSAAERGNFDWSKTTALPKVLSQVFHGVPLWIDLRWARADDAAPLNRSNEEFMKAVAKLSAPIRKLDIEFLVRKDYREHRRTVNSFVALAVGLATALVIAVVVAWYAVQKRTEAEHNLAVNDLSNAGFAIREHRSTEALHWYLRAYEHAPAGDSASLSARSLLGAWSRTLTATIVHAGQVGVVAFSPDGQMVLTGSRDKTARLWDARTGQGLGEPLKHESVVYAVAFSLDGQTVLTGSGDKTAQLWDARTRQAVGARLKHQEAVIAVAITPDGRTVLTGSRDRTARLWDARTGQGVGEPLKHEKWVRAVAFSPDGQTFLTGSGDTVRLWDMSTGQERGAPLKHEGSIFAVAFSWDGKTVLTGSSDNTAKLWDASTGQPRGASLKHEGSVDSVAFSPDGKTALTGSRDNTARLWDARKGGSGGPPVWKECSVCW